MALIKIFTSAASLPLAGYAFFYSLIYGIGFVVIYMLHMTVATKQPAMTAQTIVGYLGEARQTRAADLERLVDLIAAVAGVFLFLSGVISGYFDNKASFARLGARVARLRWLAGNFLFGYMLGSAGTVGIILGLPIDIRHIAFSSANLGYALVGHGFSLPWQPRLGGAGR